MDFQLMLAPMEGYTDKVFRTRFYRLGADLTFTEIARVANLAMQKKGELEKIDIADATPTQIQLAGSRINEYEKFLSCFKPTEGFRGFNLNLGCSSPDYTGQGLGAAMIRRVLRTNDIVKLINKAGYECSIKLRLGLDEREKEKGAYLNLIKEVPASFFVVHARTANQTLEDPADFSVYPKCVDTGKLIVANGDITTTKQLAWLKKNKLYGAMIGRAAIKSPKLFREMDYFRRTKLRDE